MLRMLNVYKCAIFSFALNDIKQLVSHPEFKTLPDKPEEAASQTANLHRKCVDRVYVVVTCVCCVH